MKQIVEQWSNIVLIFVKETPKMILLLATLFSLSGFAHSTYTINISEGFELQSRWKNARNLHSINTELDEFAPNWSDEESMLYFTQSNVRQTTNLSTLFPFLRASPSPMRFIKSEQNSEVRYSYIEFSDSLVRYTTQFTQGTRQVVQQIHKSIQSNGIWSLPEPDVMLNFPDAYSSQLTISKDKTTAVFASNRADGEGEIDLWITTKKGNQWDTPQLIGDGLNSKKNEITPQFIGSDTLLFASNGLGGKGDYDIFYTFKSGGVWSPPIPLESINTQFSESDPTLLENGDIVFTSDRSGGKGGLDLYIATIDSAPINTRVTKESVEIFLATLTAGISVSTQRTSSLSYYNPKVFFQTGTANLVIPTLDSSYYEAFFTEIGTQYKARPRTILLQVDAHDSASLLLAYKRAEVLTSMLLAQNIDSSFIDKNVRLTKQQNVKISGEYSRIIIPGFTTRAQRNDVAITIKNPDIQFEIDARPRERIQSFSLQSIIGNSLTTHTKNENPLLPIRVTVPIGEFQNEVRAIDSIKFIITFITTDSSSIQRIVTLPIQRSAIIDRDTRFTQALISAATSREMVDEVKSITTQQKLLKRNENTIIIKYLQQFFLGDNGINQSIETINQIRAECKKALPTATIISQPVLSLPMNSVISPCYPVQIIFTNESQ